MVKKIAQLSFFILLVVATACEKKTIHLNETTTLKINQTAQITISGNNYTIQFNKLLEESRCQPGAECFWMGQVAVQLQLNDQTVDSVGFHTTIPSTIPFQNKTLKLLEVNYDKDAYFGQEAHCSIKFRVE